MSGELKELWVYCQTVEGQEGVAFVELAGGTKIPMVADTAARMRALRPFAERMAATQGEDWTLRHFVTDSVEVIAP